MQQYKVAICRFPGSGFEHWGSVSWLMGRAVEMKEDPRIGGVELIVESDTPITMTRNRAVRKALDLGCDYILMIDSDMIPDYRVGSELLARPFWRTAWDWMMRRREAEGPCLGSGYPPATIAAPYCGPPPDESVYVFRWKSGESDCPDLDFRLEMIEREDAAFCAGFEEVAALPTGLILYDARVFRELPPPWFAYEWTSKEQLDKATTEDVYQTRNAGLLKMPQYVLWDSWAAHVKTKVVGKPKPITADQVHDSLAAAVKKGRHRGQRLAFVSRHDGPPTNQV